MKSSKKTAGRVPSVSTNVLYECLINYEIFDSNGNLKKATDQIWNDILDDEKLKGKIEKQNLYLGVLRTRKGLLKSLKNYFFNNKVTTVATTKTDDKSKQNPEIRDDGAIKNLILLQHTVDYKDVIKEVCGNPIHVIYLTTEEIQAWKDVTNLLTLKEEPLIFIYSNKYIDNVLTFNKQSDRIMFYGLITHLEEVVIPIYQTVSEKKHKQFFDYAIREFLRIEEVSNPNDILVPSTLAVIEGCLKAFNSQSLSTYIKILFKWKEDFKKGTNLPITCIHTDIMPILRLIQCLDKTDDDKDFYVQFLFNISLISNLDKFRSAVLNLLVFALSESRNDYIDTTQAQLQSSFLADESICKLFNEYKIMKQIKDNNDPLIDDFMTERCSTAICYNYIQEIRNEAEAFCTPYKKFKTLSNPYRMKFDDDHHHYVEKLMNFLTYFPIWTRVNFSENGTIDCLMQIRKSNEYFQLFASSKSKNDYEKKNEIVSLTNKVLNSADTVNIDENGHESKMKVEDFVTCHIEFLQHQLQNVCRRIETIPKRTQPIIKKKIRTKQTEVWKGKGDRDCNAPLELSTIDFSAGEKNNENGSYLAQTLDKDSMLQQINGDTNCDGVDYSLDQCPIENQICTTVSVDNLAPSKLTAVSENLSLFGDSMDSSMNDIKNYHDKKTSTLKNSFGYNSHTIEVEAIAKDHTYCLKDSKSEKSSNIEGTSNDDYSISFNESSLLNSTPIDFDPNYIKETFMHNCIKSEDNNNSLLNKTLSTSQICFNKQDVSVEPKLKKMKLKPKSRVRNAIVKKVLKNKKPSKFFSAFKEARQYYKTPRKRLYRSILIKSGKCRMFRYKKKKYVFESTSHIDSLIELTSRSVRNYPEFKTYCRNQVEKYGNQFLKTILEHVDKNDLRSVNRNRCHLLYQHGKIYGYNFITCREGIDVFFQKLMENSFSVKETLSCEVCHINEDKYYCTKSVSSKHFELDELQNFVARPENAYAICETCHNNLTITQDFSNYVAIDLSNTNKIYDIEKIPKTLNIDHNKFTLCGLIRFVPPIKGSKLNHYIAYVRNLRRGWKAYNNLSKTKNVSPVKCIRISLLFYVKVNVS